MASSGFLSEFPAIATEAWESAIRSSVSGPEYPAKLIWHAEEGLEVKPYYRRDEEKLRCLAAAPGAFPFARGTRTNGDWRIREEIDAADPEQANQLAVEAVAAGADEISFAIVENPDGAYLAQLLAGLSDLPVRLQGLSPRSGHVVAGWLRESRNCRPLSAEIDPFADLDISAQLCATLPGARLLSIDAEEYEESGLGSIEQIAFALAKAVDFLDAVEQRGVSIPQAAGALTFSFSMGPKLFVDIAKLRAFRLLWARVVESFGGSGDCAKAVVYARTARWNTTVYDPHVNILRATTEAFSAVLGGADSIAVTPFDECYRTPDSASRAIARNLQLVLKHECGSARVADPLGGAYLIEALTSKIATRAWKLFQEIEAGGGYRKANADEIFNSITERRRTDRSVAISRRKVALTGTNRFANADEHALNRVDSDLLHTHARAAQLFEELRLRSETASLNGQNPKACLAVFGDARMRNARAQFAADFLACAGFHAEALPCSSPAELAEVNANLVVLCSSDPEYLPFAANLRPLLADRNERTIVAVAGNPESVEELKRLGITDFTHARSNAVEVLARLQQTLGMEG